jgi:hypothetical protein
VTEKGFLFTWATAFRKEFYSAEEQHLPSLGLGLQGATVGKNWPPQRVTALEKEWVGSVAAGSDFTLVTTEAGNRYKQGG